MEFYLLHNLYIYICVCVCVCVWHIPEHNDLILGKDMNAHWGKYVNNKLFLHKLSNRNGEYLADFSLENSLSCLNTKFQKGKEKYRRTPTQIILKRSSILYS